MSTSVVVQGRLTRDATPVEFLVAGGRIEAIRAPGATTDRPVVGGADCLVAEGFLDMQVNGFAAVDFNRPALTGEEVRRATEAMWRTGVTQFLPTVVTASVRDMLGTLKAIARAREQDPAVRRAIPGIHLEGPFLAPEDGPRGAHPADSIRDPSVDGLSIYTLSDKGSDKEAAALAAKENQSDVIAGVDLSGDNSAVAPILIDLAQRDTMNKSSRFAETAITELSHATDILPRQPHRSAALVVLKAPDVPAVLIELGYLSNPHDAGQMQTAAWRDGVADAIAGAVDRHFAAAGEQKAAQGMQ